jgi:hypothetical protein
MLFLLFCWYCIACNSFVLEITMKLLNSYKKQQKKNKEKIFLCFISMFVCGPNRLLPQNGNTDATTISVIIDGYTYSKPEQNWNSSSIWSRGVSCLRTGIDWAHKTRKSDFFFSCSNPFARLSNAHTITWDDFSRSKYWKLHKWSKINSSYSAYSLFN